MIEAGEPRLHRPSHARIVDNVYHALREAILSGRIHSGERLVESQVATELDVSRGTIREALLMLARDRLVTIRPRKGAMVTRIGPGDARDIKMNRALLESFAVGIGADRVGPELVLELDTTLVEMQKCSLPDDLPRWVESDVAFHQKFVDLADSSRLLSLWTSLNGQIGALMLGGIDRKHLKASDLFELHRSLVDVVREGDLHTIQQAIVEHYIRPEDLDISEEVSMTQAIDTAAALTSATLRGNHE